jgi:Ca-activated chloride channel homolog
MATRTARATALMIAGTLILALPLFAATTQRLTITANPADTAEAEYAGRTEINVFPPFEEARVTIAVDGQTVLSRGTSPWKATVDFGPSPVEHEIRIVAVSRDGRQKVEWKRLINRGHKPLGVKLSLRDGMMIASTTAPADDPVVSVEFYDGSTLVKRLTSPPWQAPIPPSGIESLVQVTAKSRSGLEVIDFQTLDGDVMVQSVDVRTIPLFVSVVDRNGKTHTDLDRGRFRIFDNGKETRILEFGMAFDQPISLALIVDASASMTYEIAAVTKQVTRFASSILREGDRAAFFAVRSVPRREVALTGDLESVRSALANVPVGGDTSLYDAISAAIRELQHEKNRRAIVILTDGADTSSYYSYDEILAEARRAAIPIYVVAFGDDPSLARDIDRLRLLTSDTGGFLALAAREELAKKYAMIEKDLRAQYAIKYQVAAESKSNEWRPIRVVVDSPQLEARTIRGYFAP